MESCERYLKKPLTSLPRQFLVVQLCLGAKVSAKNPNLIRLCFGGGRPSGQHLIDANWSARCPFNHGLRADNLQSDMCLMDLKLWKRSLIWVGVFGAHNSWMRFCVGRVNSQLQLTVTTHSQNKQLFVPWFRSIFVPVLFALLRELRSTNFAISSTWRSIKMYRRGRIRFEAVCSAWLGRLFLAQFPPLIGCLH
jgi:hypothetical protein